MRDPYFGRRAIREAYARGWMYAYNWQPCDHDVPVRSLLARAFWAGYAATIVRELCRD